MKNIQCVRCVRHCLGWKGKYEESHPSTVGGSKSDRRMRAKAQLCEEMGRKLLYQEEELKILIVYF